MNKVAINGNVLTEEHMWGTNKYEIVESVPKGYFLSRDLLNGDESYIAVKEWLNPYDKHDFSVNVHTFKAIKVGTEENAELISLAAFDGAHTLKDAYRLLKKFGNLIAKGKASAMTKERYRVINAALPLLEKLKWD